MAIEVFVITPKKMRDINEISETCTTMFPNWENFVEESIDLALDFWGPEPGLAINKGMEWFPHYTKNMKDTLRAPPNKEGTGGFGEENYQMVLKKSRDWYKKNGVGILGREIHDDELDDFPNNLELAKMDFLPKPHTSKTVRSGDMRDINDIVTKNSYFKTAKDFFDEALELSITWWKRPKEAIIKFYEWYGEMTDEQHVVMRDFDEKMYDDFVTGYHAWLEQQGMKEQQLQPKSPGTSQKEIVLNEDHHYQQNDISDKAASSIAELCENLEETQSITNDMRKVVKRKEFSDAKENKETGEIEGRLPYDEYPLIWGFYSRFLPVKVVISELAYMLAEKESLTVNYNDFRERAYYTALGLSERIREYESKKGRKRNQKISAGLPQPPVDERFLRHQQQIDEKKAKFYSSKLRFQEHFIGMSEEAWVKKQNLSGKDLEKHLKKYAKPIRNKNGIAFFDGALNAMGLVNFVAKKKGGSEEKGYTYRIEVGLSEKGAKFLQEENPVLVNYNAIATQRYHPTNALSMSEANFIKKEIIPRFPLEDMIIKKIESELTRDGISAKGKGGIEYHIQNEFKKWKMEYDSEGDHPYHRVLEKTNYVDPNDTSDVAPWRVATMGRLSEMGMVNWEIESGTGISRYSLKTRKETGEKKMDGLTSDETMQLKQLMNKIKK